MALRRIIRPPHGRSIFVFMRRLMRFPFHPRRFPHSIRGLSFGVKIITVFGPSIMILLCPSCPKAHHFLISSNRAEAIGLGCVRCGVIQNKPIQLLLALVRLVLR